MWHCWDHEKKENEVKEIFNSIKVDPKYPKNFKAVDGGTKKFNIKNKGAFEMLRRVEWGEWKKAHEDGFIDSEIASVYYFQTKSGKVFDVKVKKGIWSVLE